MKNCYNLYRQRHIDSARMYHNEAAVAEGVRASGIPREDIFISLVPICYAILDICV
jgi:hypothetical protein